MNDLYFKPRPLQIQAQSARPVTTDTAELCAGIKRVVNDVLRFLLTVQGSDPLDPEFGSRIANLLATTMPPEGVDIFYLEADRCATYYRRVQQGLALPPSERLVSVVVAEIVENSADVGFSVVYEVRTSEARALTELPGLQ